MIFSLAAICEGGCSGQGTCVRPNECDCDDGWRGPKCSDDIDECMDPSPICSNCTNTHGSFYCTCPDGNTLPHGQPSCIEPPQMVSADSITSNSLLMNWAAPMLNELDGTLKNYSLSCSADEDVNASFIHVLDSNVNTYNVSGLKPATTYSCCIMASTTTGQSRRECREVSTLEDVPSSPPDRVTVKAVSPFAVELEWSTPLEPNGDLTHYSVYTASSTLIDTVNASQTYYLYSGLMPYMNVSVCVTASSRVGEGPKSPVYHVTTRESVPGRVQNFKVVVVSDTSFSIIWEPPVYHNGILTGYLLTVTNLITLTGNETYLDPGVYNTTVNNVEPYVPYEVTVSARTIAGVGDNSNEVKFTKDGVPFVAPTILSLKRTSATSAHIKWEQLKPQDLRGNTSYQIFYVVDKCQAVFSLSDDSTPPIEVLNTEYLLSNVFEPQYEYCVGITAITSAGTGPFQSMTLSWYDFANFSLIFQITTTCSEWIEELPSEKIEDLADDISQEIRLLCQCDFPRTHVTNTSLRCDQDSAVNNVELKGVLIGTNERDSVTLVGDLELWLSNMPTVSVQGQQVQVLNPYNEDDEPESKTASVAIGVGTAVGTLLLLLAVSFVTVFIIYFKYRYRSSKNEPDQNESNNTNDEYPEKVLQNPFYGYGTHKIESGADSPYSTVEATPLTVKQVDNPMYSAHGSTKKEDVVANPMYGLNQEKPQTVEVAFSANSGIYTLLPSTTNECAYENTSFNS